MVRKTFTKYRPLLLMALLFSIFATSCSKDDDPNPVQENPENEAIAKKWEVDQAASNGRLSAEAGDFLWFEFTVEGYFIILKTDVTTVTGTYSKSGNIITLDNHGVLEINDLDDKNFSFTFTAKGTSKAITIFTTVAEEVVETSTKTELLCRTWTIKRQHGNIGGFTYDNTYPNANIKSYTAVFSVYGTYLISMELADGTKSITNRLWQWKDSEQTKICYGIFSSECTDENQTTVLELNENNFKLHTVIPSMELETTDELVKFQK